MTDFSNFTACFPKDVKSVEPINALFAGRIESEFGIIVPEGLKLFWRHFGGGYFGNRELLFFADCCGTRDLVLWNREEFWKDIFPSPKDGGPLFFAENCFGDQIGFRLENGKALVILFVVDTFESFVIADDFGVLFEDVLGKDTEVINRPRLNEIREKLGVQSLNNHYAPIVSFLVGGSEKPENFHQESARVHLLTTVAAFKALQ